MEYLINVLRLRQKSRFECVQTILLTVPLNLVAFNFVTNDANQMKKKCNTNAEDNNWKCRNYSIEIRVLIAKFDVIEFFSLLQIGKKAI